MDVYFIIKEYKLHKVAVIDPGFYKKLHDVLSLWTIGYGIRVLSSLQSYKISSTQSNEELNRIMPKQKLFAG